MGDGAAIASTTGLPVVSDLRSIDVALGGQGAPIVPVGEKLLFEGHELFLNLGGISNISYHQHNTHRAFDVCPANRVLNLLSMKEGKSYDEDGQMASSGRINEKLLEELNGFSFYTKLYPKSLENEFGTEIIYPKILSYQLSVSDALATYVEHIAFQIANAVKQIKDENQELNQVERSLFITGGGAFNKYLVSRIENYLLPISISIVVPEIQTVKYKEAVIMALLGVLRWREEETVYASVTGASRNSIGGALWLGAN